MEAREFVRAILDDPDEDFPRLVFADWLEEAGQVDRAEWVRASCELARLSWHDVGFEAATERVESAWSRCRPKWCDLRPYSGVSMHTERGLIQLSAVSQVGTVRVGKIRWMNRALDEGWLGCVAIILGIIDRPEKLLTSWVGAAREVPLRLGNPAGWVDERGMAAILDVPHLWGIELSARPLRRQAAIRLWERSDLRDLRIDLRDVHDDRNLARIDLEPLGRLVGLRRLSVSWGDRPDLDEFRFLDGLSKLRRLSLSGGFSSLTDEALGRVAALPSLRRLSIEGFDGYRPDGLDWLLADRPDLIVEDR